MVIKMKKNRLEEVNIMEGINFEKARYQARKAAKTRRIHKQERARKTKILKIALTIETIVISLVIYGLTGILGELAQTSTFYMALCILSWAWLFGGQIVALCMIWCDEDER